jgi:hypothetical protein
MRRGERDVGREGEVKDVRMRQHARTRCTHNTMAYEEEDTCMAYEEEDTRTYETHALHKH